jgi:hypothetical protein
VTDFRVFERRVQLDSCRLLGSVRDFRPRGEQGIAKSNKDCTRPDGRQSRDLGLPHSRQMWTSWNAWLGALVKPDVLGFT